MVVLGVLIWWLFFVLFVHGIGFLLAGVFSYLMWHNYVGWFLFNYLPDNHFLFTRVTVFICLIVAILIVDDKK